MCVIARASWTLSYRPNKPISLLFNHQHYDPYIFFTMLGFNILVPSKHSSALAKTDCCLLWILIVHFNTTSTISMQHLPSLCKAQLEPHESASYFNEASITSIICFGNADATHFLRSSPSGNDSLVGCFCLVISSIMMPKSHASPLVEASIPCQYFV